ncbi:uncharacterized protein FYW47_018941 isoform 2-T2 [Aplochiton taeniatus]
MPPKREAPSTTVQPPVKMIKMTMDRQDIGDDQIEEKFRIPEDMSEVGLDEDGDLSPEMRTDTVSLLMKIDQLQTQLKYERRCRIMAEKELRQIKEMNSLLMQMRHTAHDLRATLNQARQENNPMPSVPLSSEEDEGITFITETEAEMDLPLHIPEEEDDFLHLSESLRVPRNLYQRVAEISDFKKYTSALLMMLFDRETLATHSLQGRRTNLPGGEDFTKPQLPPYILTSLIDHVRIKFGVDIGQVKTAIRTKLNNEDKLLKKRLGIR